MTVCVCVSVHLMPLGASNAIVVAWMMDTIGAMDGPMRWSLLIEPEPISSTLPRLWLWLKKMDSIDYRTHRRDQSNRIELFGSVGHMGSMVWMDG